MPVQTAYNYAPGVGFAGLMGNGTHRVRSIRNSEVVNAPFGVMFSKAAADDQAGLLAAAATDAFIGISVNQFARPALDLSSPTTQIAASAMFDLLEKGDIFVIPEENVDPTKDVYVRIAANGGNTQKGSFRASGDSATAVKLKGARWMSTATAGNPALLRFDSDVQASSDALEVTFDQASTSATATQKIFKTRADRHFVVDQVTYNNPTGLAGSDTNNYVIALKQGSTVIAQYSTAITGGQSTITADTPTDLVLQAAANLIVPPGTILTLSETLTGTLTLPAGRLMVHGHYV